MHAAIVGAGSGLIAHALARIHGKLAARKQKQSHKIVLETPCPTPAYDQQLYGLTFRHSPPYPHSHPQRDFLRGICAKRPTSMCTLGRY